MSNRIKPKKTKVKKEKKVGTNNPDLFRSGNTNGNFSQNNPTKKVHKNRKF